MFVSRQIDRPPPQHEDWDARWGTLERTIVTCWLVGIDFARQAPDVAIAASRGELPVLPWKGGVDIAPKTLAKVGALQYLAMWQGLRREDLAINLDQEVEQACSRTGVVVTFTGNLGPLSADAEVDE